MLMLMMCYDPNVINWALFIYFVTNPLKKISCLLSKIFHSKESYTSLANLCLLGRIILWIAYGQMTVHDSSLITPKLTSVCMRSEE